MDVTYIYEFDVKRFERSVKRALSFSFRGDGGGLRSLSVIMRP